MRYVARKLCGILALLLVLLGMSGAASPAAGASKVIRVGWHDFAGFYMEDGSGHRSGYVYDYLQELARYGGWKYEYVKGTVTECVQMLEDGQIDLMGAMMHSPDRAETMEFSKMSMGKNYSVLSTRAEDNRYLIGDSKSLDNARIGALDGDIRQEALAQYAEEQGFGYRLVQYATPELMERALHEQAVDAILTTNMRVTTEREQVVAQFSPVDFYFAATKGNRDLMDAVDAAMEQIEFTRKGFQPELAQKYFSVDMSGALSFTEEEKAFIRSSSAIRVILPAPRRPMAYKQKGEYKGIVVDIMNELAERIGIAVEYLPVDTQSGGVEALSAGEGDVMANVYDDYGWAESNNLFLSRPYMTLNYAAITRADSPPADSSARVAAVTGYRFSADYVERVYQPEQIEWYANESAAIEAVCMGARDVCFVSTLAANEALSDYRCRNLYSSAISYSHGLSVGVSKENQTLVSLIDKAIASMGDGKIRAIVDSNTMLSERPFNPAELIMRYPMQFIGIFGSVVVIILVLLASLAIVRSNRKKNEEIYRAQLAAEHDSLTGLYNRLAFEVVVTERLQKQHGGLTGAFVMLDIDLFKQINDQNGHGYGDTVLSQLADKLRELFEGGGALLCRMGGDEFALFFPEWSRREELLELLQNCQRELKQGAAAAVPIPCSFGVAFVSERLCDFSALYLAADEALYSAKRAGRGTLRVAEDLAEE